MGAITVLATAFGISQFHRAQASAIRLEASRQRAIFSLISHVENMEASMAKARAASTQGQQTTFLTTCWSFSEAARDSMAQLSMANADLTNIRHFVSTVGDYSRVLSQKASRGDPITQAEWQELSRLESSVKDLARGLLDLGRHASAVGSGGPATSQGFGLAAIVSAMSPRYSETGDKMMEGFSEIDSMTQSVPSPVYDGPFSDRNLAQAALARPGETISVETAKSTAEKFLRSDDSFQSFRVEDNSGSIPGYVVTGKRADGTEVTVAVAKQGGAVLWATDSRKPGPAVASDTNQARAVSESFLASKGFSGMAETGWRKPGPDAGRIMFAYAPEITFEEREATYQVRLYPDIVKLEIGLDGGSVLSFEQTGYLTTHEHPSRKLKAPLVSENEARSTLRKDLQVESDARLCVIPLLPTREVMAWEFRCSQGADSYLVYVNAMDGREEAIFQVISGDEGSLTV